MYLLYTSQLIKLCYLQGLENYAPNKLVCKVLYNMRIIKTSMAYKNFTVSVDESIIKEIKRIAFESEESQKDIVNRYLKEGIKRETGQTTFDE